MVGKMTSGGPQVLDSSKKSPNLQNYKIVKCKYWDKEGTCRYGSLCTFAHGETEIRSKTDNLLMTPTMDYGYPQMDPNMMNPMMNPYAMGFDPYMMMGMPPMSSFQTGYDPNMMNPNFMNPNIMPPNMMNPNLMYGNPNPSQQSSTPNYPNPYIQQQNPSSNSNSN